MGNKNQDLESQDQIKRIWRLEISSIKSEVDNVWLFHTLLIMSSSYDQKIIEGVWESCRSNTYTKLNFYELKEVNNGFWGSVCEITASLTAGNWSMCIHTVYEHYRICFGFSSS